MIKKYGRIPYLHIIMVICLIATTAVGNRIGSGFAADGDDLGVAGSFKEMDEETDEMSSKSEGYGFSAKPGTKPTNGEDIEAGIESDVDTEIDMEADTDGDTQADKTEAPQDGIDGEAGENINGDAGKDISQNMRIAASNSMGSRGLVPIVPIASVRTGNPTTVEELIPDVNLRNGIADQVFGGADITLMTIGAVRTGMAGVTTAPVNLSNMGITNLLGLECFTSLETLYLESNRITDVAPLTSLSGLQTLSLKNNFIQDFTALPVSIISKDYTNNFAPGKSQGQPDQYAFEPISGLAFGTLSLTAGDSSSPIQIKYLRDSLPDAAPFSASWMSTPIVISSNPSVATVSRSGVSGLSPNNDTLTVTALSSGSTTISYVLTAGASSSTNVVVSFTVVVSSLPTATPSPTPTPPTTSTPTPSAIPTPSDGVTVTPTQTPSWIPAATNVPASPSAAPNIQPYQPPARTSSPRGSTSKPEIYTPPTSYATTTLPPADLTIDTNIYTKNGEKQKYSDPAKMYNSTEKKQGYILERISDNHFWVFDSNNRYLGTLVIPYGHTLDTITISKYIVRGETPTGGIATPPPATPQPSTININTDYDTIIDTNIYDPDGNTIPSGPVGQSGKREVKQGYTLEPLGDSLFSVYDSAGEYLGKLYLPEGHSLDSISIGKRIVKD